MSSKVLESNPSYVQNLFGISQGLVPLLARMRGSRHVVTVETSGGSDHLSQTTRFLSRQLSSLAEITIDDGVGCKELYPVLQEWVDDRSCIISTRVQAGNSAYGSAF